MQTIGTGSFGRVKLCKQKKKGWISSIKNIEES
jgi:hypothetical protein